MGQARHGQGLHLPSPRVCPLTDLFHHSFTPSVVLAESTSLPAPSPLAPDPRPISLAFPILAQQWMGEEGANTLLSISCPTRMTVRLGWRKTTPMR